MRRKILLLIAAGGIVNLIIAIYCIPLYRGPFAILGQLGVVLIGVLFTKFYCAIVLLACKFCNKYSVFISMIFVLAMGIGYYNFIMSDVNPKPLTEEQLIKNAIKRAKEHKKEASKLLKEAELFVPNDEIIAKDKGILEEAFRSICDSIQCDFILYSQCYQHFISVLTYYQYYSNRTEHYSGLVLFCEKEENTINVYNYTSPLDQYGGISREGYLHRAILHMKNSMGYHNGLSSKYTLKTDEFLEYPHPLKKAFWQDKYFFSIISIQGENYLRYQTELRYNHSNGKHEYIPRPVYRIISIDSISK